MKLWAATRIKKLELASKIDTDVFEVFGRMMTQEEFETGADLSGRNELRLGIVTKHDIFTDVDDFEWVRLEDQDEVLLLNGMKEKMEGA